MRAHTEVPCYYIGSTVHECCDWCHVIYDLCHSVFSLSLSLSLSAFSLCQLVLLLPRSFCGSVFVLLHLTKMSHRRILDYYYYYYYYLYRYSTKQSPLAEANRFSASQEIPQFNEIPRFITAFTSASHLSLCLARSSQSIPHIPLPEEPS